jgi:hypothetical protein
MQLTRRSALIGLGLVGLVPRLAMAGLKIARVGTVDSVSGACMAVSRGEVRQLSVGSLIFRGDILATGDNARLAFTLGKTTHLVLTERMRVNIDGFLIDHNISIDDGEPGRG